MKCPFHQTDASPRTPDANASAACPFTGAKTGADAGLGRRSMLGLLTAGLSGLFVGLPGCMSVGAEDEGEQAGAQTAASFLAEYDAAPDLQSKGAVVSKWLAAKPMALFAELRAERPVLHTGQGVPTLVARYDDVLEVMDDNATFTVAPYQKEAAFLLDWFTLADSRLDVHDTEKAIFQRVVTAQSAESFRSAVRRHAEALVAESKGTATIDVVRAVAEPLPVKVIHDYFGVPSGVPGGPSVEELGEWIGTMFRNFFLNLGGRDADVVAEGRDRGAKLLAYLTSLVAQRKRELLAPNAEAPRDVLGQLVLLGQEADFAAILTDDRIAKNMIGIIAGAGLGTVGKSIANIMDVLTDPKWGTGATSPWSRVVRAARNDDTDEIWRLCREALRFNPQGVAIARAVVRPATVGGVALPPGTVVLASTLSAMHDARAFPQPDRFSIDASSRRAERYLHMGTPGPRDVASRPAAGAAHRGRYECLGIHLAPIEIAEAVRALALLPNLRRGDGKLTYEDVYPSTFVLEHDG